MIRQGQGRRGAGAVALALLLSAGTAWGADGLTEAQSKVLRTVDAHYNHLRSLRTNFRETYNGMGLEKQEAGVLLLSRAGGKMRWSYTQPAGKVFVLDGKYAWSYAPGDAQAQRVPAKQMEDLRSPLRLLLGHTVLEKELTGVTVAPRPDGGSVIGGVPRGQEQRVTRLVLEVSGAGAIRVLRLEETDGAVTEFTFADGVENVPVKDSDFVFTPPMGVPVVEGLPPV